MAQNKNAEQSSIREKAEALLRRRWLILIPIAACASIAAFISMFLSPVYESTATIQINNKKIIDPLVAGFAVPGTVGDQVESLTKQIKSWPQLMHLVEKYNMADRLKSNDKLEDFVLGLKKRINIEPRGSNMLQISFRDSDPVLAQKVANDVAQSMINENVRQKKEEAQVAIKFISEQLKNYKARLEHSERNFSTHKINSDLRVALNRKRLLESQLANLQKIIPSMVKMEHSPVFVKLQTRLAELEIERARLKLDATDKHPRVKGLNTEITEIKSQLNEEMKKEMVRESVSMMNPSYLQVEQELKQVAMEAEYLEKRKKELEESGDGKKEISEEELSTLETNKKVDEDIYQMLLKQMQAAYVSEQLQDMDKGARLSVIEYARLPVRPMKPLRMNVILGGIFMGGIMGFGLMYAMEHIDRSFRTVEDAKSIVNKPILGSISKMIIKDEADRNVFDGIREFAGKYMQKYRVLSGMKVISPHIVRKSAQTQISPQVVMVHEPKCIVSEEYRILRAHVADGRSALGKAIMVTSSVRGEGKSTTTANMAVAMADTGLNVLLIDCDLRRGGVHEIFNVNQSPGLTHLITNSVSPETALAKTSVKNLTVMSCGTKPVKPSELLGSAKMESCLEKFKTQYDVVLLDAPPVLNLPDTCVLSRYSDGVIFVIQAERTQREEVVRAQSMLEQSHANLLGFVLTSVRYYIPKYLYDYYYGEYEG